MSSAPKRPESTADVSIVASLARHLAFAPVAFAVTEGASHEVRYANMAFRRLQDAGEIVIGQSHKKPPGTDLTSLLDRAFRKGETIRDELVGPPGSAPRWSCTVWPIVVDTPTPQGLVLEVRDAAFVEGALARQRAIAERLLIGALREQDTGRDAAETGRRAIFLASASRDLARSLEQGATRDIVQRSTLARKGTWCIVDVVESTGAIHRLAIVHPDPAKQELAKKLAEEWYPKPKDPDDILSLTRRTGGEPVVITKDSEAALLKAVHGPENLAVLRELGFGALLVVPMVVRDAPIGTITFVNPPGDESFSAEDIALASDLADRCAMALDNARLYREADVLRSVAQEANQAKSKFIGNMSHELRTPLNAIGGYVELLELATHGPLTTEQRTDLGRIKRNQEHLLTLISQILNFVRNESGRMEYQSAEVPVEAALQDVVELLSDAARDRRVTLEIKPPPRGAAVRADPDRVRQILLNLVTNAMKYGRANGGRVVLSCTLSSDTTSVHVADNGSGIPPEELEKIFEPFVQLLAGQEGRQGGLGLGLAISRDLARAMKGDVTVESTVGVGSRFTLTLPRPKRSR